MGSRAGVIGSLQHGAGRKLPLDGEGPVEVLGCADGVLKLPIVDVQVVLKRRFRFGGNG